jgi:hypothetical protein
VNKCDRLGQNVYEVTTSTLFLIPLHRKIVGDDGKGGAYTIEFFGVKCSYSFGIAGYNFLAKGNVQYQKIFQSALAEIKENGYNITATIETDNHLFYPGNISVDSALASEAATEVPSSYGTYVFMGHDCYSFAQTWLTFAMATLDNANRSWFGPTYPF